jgi:hypothetical protein
VEEITRKPERSTRKKALMLLVLALVLTPVGYLGVHKIGVEMDRKERVPHANCEVLEKSKIGTDLYLIKTSCGDYEAIERMHDFLNVGTEYDMQVTKGNWARNPRLAVANSCAKPSQKPIPSQSPVPTPMPTDSSEFVGGSKDA